MAVFKRGKIQWYKFRFNGEQICESTKQGNADVARTMEAAHRTKLALGEVGIREKKKAPTLKEFEPRFDKFIESECKPKDKGESDDAKDSGTLKFYRERMKRLLEYPALANSPLDEIDVEKIGKFKTDRQHEVTRLGRAPAISSINGELRTLRRLMRVAEDWKIIAKAPKIKLLTGEHERDFVLSYAQERDYLQAAPQPLSDIALLILEEGMRPDESATAEWANIHLEPAQDAALGYLHIPGGKTKNAKRNLSLTTAAQQMLTRRKKAGARGARYVFPNPETGEPYLVSSLDHEHADLREDLAAQWKGTPMELKALGEFVIHSLRHTSLTRFGESGAGAFEIMKFAGHSSITTSQRYVHPTPEGQERATTKMDEMNRAKRAQLGPQAVKVGTNLGTPAKKTDVKKAAKLLAVQEMGA